MKKRFICGPCVFRVKGESAKVTGDIFEYDFADDACESAALASGSVRLHPDQSGMPQPPPPEDEPTGEVTMTNTIRWAEDAPTPTRRTRRKGTSE